MPASYHFVHIIGIVCLFGPKFRKRDVGILRSVFIWQTVKAQPDRYDSTLPYN